MIDYFIKYHHKLLAALAEHMEIVLLSLALSLLLAALLTMAAMISNTAAIVLTGFFSMIYAIPSLAMFALLIPLTGLGRTTAILVLTMYNQYLLLGNFITGLNEVDASVIDAAAGMGMTTWQILTGIRIPLAGKALFAGVRIALVSTISIATIAASINAGGLGTILFDGLRTLNVYKIVWGSLLSVVLAISVNSLLRFAEQRL